MLTKPLRALASLEQGWLNGQGEKLDVNHLAILADKFDEYYSKSLALPLFYPTFEGGVWMEWGQDPNWSVSLKVDLQSLHAEYDATYLPPNCPTIDVQIDLDLNTEAGWATLNTELGKFRTFRLVRIPVV